MFSVGAPRGLDWSTLEFLLLEGHPLLCSRILLTSCLFPPMHCKFVLSVGSFHSAYTHAVIPPNLLVLRFPFMAKKLLEWLISICCSKFSLLKCPIQAFSTLCYSCSGHQWFPCCWNQNGRFSVLIASLVTGFWRSWLLPPSLFFWIFCTLGLQDITLSLFSSYLNAPWSLSPLMGPPYVLDPNMLMCPRTHSSYLFSYLHSLSRDLDICYFLCLENSSRYPQPLLLHLRSGSWVVSSVSSSLMILLNYTPSLTLCTPSHLDLIFSTTVIIQHIYNYLYIYRPTLPQNINLLRAGTLSVQFTVVLPAVGTVLGTRSLW